MAETNNDQRIRGIKINLHCKIMKLDSFHGLQRVMAVINQELETQRKNTRFFRGSENYGNDNRSVRG